jgi:hypothetical protein
VTIQVVPTDATGAPFYSQTTTLEGVQYLLTFSYAQREGAWYLSVADANGVDIYNGMKLVCSGPSGPIPLLWRCKDPRRPPGDLFVLSGTSDLTPPGLADLAPGSGRCALYYMTSDVLALIAGGGLATFLAQLTAGTSVGTGSTYGSQ